MRAHQDRTVVVAPNPRVAARAWWSTCLIFITLPAATAAEFKDVPNRHPEGGVKFEVTVEVPWSTLGYGDGRRESFDGRVALYPPDEKDLRNFRVVSEFYVNDGDGKEISVPETRITLDKEGDPAAAVESLAAGIPREDRYRLFATSDIALVPLRMVFRHEMPTGRGGTADKVKDIGDFRVTWSERFLGVERVSATMLQKFESRIERTHKPSGLRILDYTLTFEDERDDTVLASFGVRMFVDPSRAMPDGRAAPAGVHHISVIKCYQLDWRQERTVIGENMWEPLLERWFSRLSDQLFFALDLEGIGDPYQSPSAFALRALHVFDASSVGRLTSTGSTKTLAAISPQLVEAPLAFDPAHFAKAYRESADPVTRLLLAAGAAAAGGATEEYLRAADVGLHSKSTTVQRAAAKLARALADPKLIPALTSTLSAAGAEDVQIQAALALGTIGGEQAVAVLIEQLGRDGDDRVRAAACRAIADSGTPNSDTYLTGEKTRFGATSPDTGLFEVVIEDPSAASQALAELARLANAARSSDKEVLMDLLTTSLRNEYSDQPDKIALGDSAREWLVRLPKFVPLLEEEVTDPRRKKIARRIAAASGRGAIPELIARLRAAKTTEEKTRAAVLLGCTKDPRAREFLSRMQNSDAIEDFEAAAEGLSALSEDA